MSQLETNTTTIDELITMANNLPDAGSGGGGTGGGVETCNVTMSIAGGNHISYTTYADGECGYVSMSSSVNGTLNNVVCNSYIVLSAQSQMGFTYNVSENVEHFEIAIESDGTRTILFVVTSPADAIITLTIFRPK